MKEKIMVAMSGGVDSAVSAHLISERHEAAGVTMRLFGEELGLPPSPEASKAAAVCKQMGIPHFVADLTDSFRREVIDPFIKAYESGLTPNPCVFCNKALKFGALLDFAKANGYARIATGHYARIEKSSSGRYLLRRAADLTKDQSYMLYSLSQEVLSSVDLPLGSLTKNEVRAIAAELQFPMAEQKDSQDICFIPDGDYVAFIERITDKKPIPGNFISTEGTVMGEHRGTLCYTIGQRKGLGVSWSEPLYVLRKSVAENTVTLGSNNELFEKRLTAHSINLIPFDTLDAPRRLLAKIRYRQEATPARVEQIAPDRVVVEFEAPQRAISPGQSLVLYDGDYVVGGGIID